MSSSTLNDEMDVDTWLDTYSPDATINYAKFVIESFRAKGSVQIKHTNFMKQFKLFATYKGKVVRVISASRLGDVGISYNFDDDHGYDERVFISDLHDFSPTVQ